MLSIVGLFCFAILPRLSARLCILSPESLRLAYPRDPPGCIEGATATFAAPGPEDRLRGTLSWRGLGCTDQGLPGIHLARRGRCSFAQKSSVSAAAGASALLVADFEASEETDAQVADTLVAGVQGQLSLVPTFLIGQQGAFALVNATQAGEPVEVELFWGYPRPKAILDVWLPVPPVQPVDPATVAPWASATSSSLLRELAPMARELGDAVLIRPHWRVVPFEATNPALARRCARALPQLCTATGTSEDLEEVVRHHCILKGYPKLWWPYVELPCGVNCAAERGLNAVQQAAIERCVSAEGLSFLEDDREAASWGSVESTAIRINSWRYSGPMQADAVLQTLCHHIQPTPAACRVLLEEPSPGRGLPAWKLFGLCILVALLGRGFRGTLLWAILRSCKWQKRA